MSDKPFWQSNVARFIILFNFVPAAILFAFGVIATEEAKILLDTLFGGTLVYLGRDLGTKGWSAWRERSD